MELHKAKELFNTLINKNWVVKGNTYNLHMLGWTFRGFDSSVRRLGVCHGRLKKIGLSKTMTILRSEKEVENTLIHEIAHAIDREIRGTSNHDWHWKLVAREVGHSGERLSKINSEVRQNAYKWLAICPTHDVIGGWVRKPNDINNFFCKKCKSHIEVVENKQLVKVA